MKHKILLLLFILLVTLSGYTKVENNVDHISIMHSISSRTIYQNILELCKDKYEGRLTGTNGFNMSAEWVISKLEKWGLKSAGDRGTWLQKFENPYTLVKPGSSAVLHLPVAGGKTINKNYIYQDDFMAGSTSDTGKVTAEVVYVGFGITAPELDFDEYKGLDVKGKIVLMEREAPLSPDKNPEKFEKWIKYSLHQYKVKNAVKHGAAGMIYNYRIANPNCTFIKGLVLTYVGGEVIPDIFTGLQYDHKTVVSKIRKNLKPFSFNTGKIMTISNITEHHPEGIASNVLGKIEGRKSNEIIVVSAHLDHVGKNYEVIPGANDNASGVAVIMSVAKALSDLKEKPERTILFAFFGAEEQGVKGSEIFLKKLSSDKKIVACINLDGVGMGDKIHALAGTNYPKLFEYFKRSNKMYIHRTLTTSYFGNHGRPRLDASHFMWRKIPSISFSAYGKPLPYSVYHKTLDRPELLTPEIMEDLARIIFLSLHDMMYGDQKLLEF